MESQKTLSLINSVNALNFVLWWCHKCKSCMEPTHGEDDVEHTKEKTWDNKTWRFTIRNLKCGYMRLRKRRKIIVCFVLCKEGISQAVNVVKHKLKILGSKPPHNQHCLSKGFFLSCFLNMGKQLNSSSIHT